MRHHVVSESKALTPNQTSAAARARRAKPGAKGAAKPKRSAGRGREDYGWGRAGGVTKPNQVRSPATPSSHPRQREPANGVTHWR
jgi:hypothetical protein